MTALRRVSSVPLLLLFIGLAALAAGLVVIPWVVQAQSQEVTPTQAATGSNPPAKPTSLQASSEHDSVTLTWTASTDQTVTHYAVLRRNPGTDASQVFHVIESNAGPETSYSDGTVSASTTYIYRVKSVSPTGVSQVVGLRQGRDPGGAGLDPGTHSHSHSGAGIHANPGGPAAHRPDGQPGGEQGDPELERPGGGRRFRGRLRDPAPPPDGGRERPGDPGGRHRINGHDLHRRHRQRGGGALRLPGEGAAGRRRKPVVQLRQNRPARRLRAGPRRPRRNRSPHPTTRRPLA